MHNDVLQDATAAVAKNRRKSIWKRIVSVLACIVVFCTTYALILPALTLERAPECGIEEHTHTEACYIKDDTDTKEVLACDAQTLGLHVHTDSCIGFDGSLICGYSDFVIHTHNEFCFDENGALVCTLPEIYPHIHTDECYLMPEDSASELLSGLAAAPITDFDGSIASGLDNGLNGIMGHIHTDMCYVTEPGELICTLPTDAAHVHTDECYLNTNELICPLTEGEGHMHGEGCFDEAGALICTLPESAGHIHGPECYQTNTSLICTLNEGEQVHVHSDECYAQNKVLVCEIPEEPSFADDGSALLSPDGDAADGGFAADGSAAESYPENEIPENNIIDDTAETGDRGEPVCGIAEIIPHCHDESCFDANGAVICGMTEVLEHIHTQECMSALDNSDELTCTIAEGEGAHFHTVDNGCFDEDGTLICELEETEGHVHSTICYGNWTLICGIEEHTHTEECYPADDSDPEADPAHEVFCGRREHTHAGECINENGVVVCNIEEHTHSAECYIDPLAEQGVFCGKAEHIHADECFDEYGAVICGIEEHTHGEECYVEQPLIPLGEIFATIELADADDLQLFSVMTMANDIPQDLTGMYDFRPNITTAVLDYKENGQWKSVVGSNHTIKEDDEIRFTINYVLPGHSISHDNPSITCQLPAGIKIVKEQEGNVYGSDETKPAGRYKITSDGLIVITFEDDAYISLSENNSTLNGKIIFFGGIDNGKLSGEDKYLDINETVSIGPFDVYPPDNSNVEVGKSGSEVNSDGTIDYKVTVTSTNGTTNPVKIEDTIETNLPDEMTLDQSSITVKTNKSNETVSEDGFTKNGNTFSFNLPAMEAGEIYTITYKYKLPDSYKDSTIDITANNKVKASTNKNDGSTVNSNEGKYTVEHTQSYLEKDGAPTGDGKINWTITVNSGNHDIGGWQIKDKFNGVDLPDSAFPLTMTGPSGSSVQITKDQWPYTFPEGTKYQYTITYSTPATATPGSDIANNEAELDDNDPATENPKADKPVKVDNYYQPVTKTAVSLTPNDESGTAAIKWHVKISADQGALAAPWTYRDELFDNWEGTQMLTEEQFSAIEAEVKSKVSNPNNVSVTRINQYGNGKLIGFEITFNEDLQQGQAIEFDYTSTGTISGNPATKIFKNYGRFNKGNSVEALITYTHLLEKHDNFNDSYKNKPVTYHDYKDTNGILKWVVYIDPPAECNGDLTVTENLPDGIELNSVFLKTQDNGWTTVDIKDSGDNYKIPQWEDRDYYYIKTVRGTDSLDIIIPNALVAKMHGQNRRIEIYIEAKIKDDFVYMPDANGIPTGSFTNTVVLKDGNGDLDSKTQTQYVSKQLLQKNDVRDKNKPETTHTYDDINGELQWEIFVTPPTNYANAFLDIVEQLPPGVTITRFELCPNRGFSSINMLEDNSYTFQKDSESYVVTRGSVKLQDGEKVTVSIPKDFINAKTSFTLYVNAKINDDYHYTQDPNSSNTLRGRFTNKVSADGISVEQTQNVNKQLKQVLTKDRNGDVINDVIPYHICINPDGRQLLSKPGGTLQLVDTIREEEGAWNYLTLDLLVNTVELRRLGPDGKTPVGEPLDIGLFNLQYEKSLDPNNSKVHIYKITMDVPDATPLYLKYSYKSYGESKDGFHPSVKNSAELKGTDSDIFSDVEEFGFAFSGSQSSIKGDQVTLRKYENGKPLVGLPNAKFAIYKYDSEAKEFVRDIESGAERVVITGSKGEVDVGVTPNVAYYAVEIEAPSGYKLDRETRHYFMLTSKDTTTYPLTAPDNFSDLNPDTKSVNFTVWASNEPTTTSITVKKLWRDDKGNPYTPEVDSISVMLYRNIINKATGQVIASKQPYPAGQNPDYSSPIEITPTEFGWVKTIPSLPKEGTYTDPATSESVEVTYTYCVDEVPLLDTTPSYSGNNKDGIVSDTIIITNTVETEPKHELPQTGGGGIAPITALGGGVIAITLILALIKSAGYKKRGKEDFSSS